jgi:vitamin B12 transporter
VQFAGKRFSSSTKLYWNAGKNNFPFINSAQVGNPEQRLPNAATRQFGGLQEFQGWFKRNELSLKVWAFTSERELPPTMLTANTLETQSDRAIRSVLRWRKYIPQAYLQTNVAYFRESLTYRHPTAGIFAPSSFDRIIVDGQYVRHSGGEPIFKFQNAGLRFVHDEARSDGLPVATQQNLWSAFAHGELSLGKEKFSKIGLVLREELYNQQFSPLLGLIGCSFGNKTRLSASLSRNYRYPTLNDRYWVPGGNAALRPEKSLSGEFSILRWQPLGPQGILEYSLGGYWNEVDDWILWLPGNGNIWSPENVQHVQARGIEANFHWKDHFQNIFPWMYHDISLHYNFNDSRNQDGDQLIYTPQHNATFRLHLTMGALEPALFSRLEQPPIYHRRQ